ncbi:MAG TPA: hypothetical protein PKE45_08965 [Caldilineaceae bacterium]|nr:hypothetical protein [Caldilineaceae bacterium]
MPKTISPHLQELRSLAGQPDEQKRLAVTLLNPRLGNEVIFSALQILQRGAPPEARPALLALYAHYAQGSKTRDPAANLRAAILRALRTIVIPADLPLLTTAVETYVFPPPSFKEEGASLRSAALNALNEVDETLARFHAIRLLANEHTDPMSGEPALSAAHLLAALGEQTALYFYVMQDGARTLPEVLSEALRHLIAVPEAMLPGLIARYSQSEQEVVLVGLFDLLIHHRSGPHQLDLLAGFLRTSQQLAAYRYLATVLLTSGHKVLIEELLAAAKAENRRDQLLILIDVLALLPAAPAVQRVRQELQERLLSAGHGPAFNR